MSDPLLLDTHVCLWFMRNDPRLGREARENLDRASLEARLAVSVISIWELAMLEAKGRIRLEPDAETWVEDMLVRARLYLLGLSPAIAVLSTRLAGYKGADPADRIIVATAVITGRTLITADEEVLLYASSRRLRAEAV